MALIERYIFGRLMTSFTMALLSLAGVVWLTQALQSMNLVTARGQTLIVFFEITVLALPQLLVIIAPFALLIGGIFTLNGLNADSELVIIGAAGGSRTRVARPVYVAAATVMVAMVLFTHAVAPFAQHVLREAITKVNVDLVANIVRPGRFTELEKGLTFHIRNRAGDGTLVGLMIDDERDKDVSFTYFADHANVVEAPGKTLLVMRDGVLQRVTARDGALSVIDFEAYAFDLSQLAAQSAVPTFRPSERTTGELFETDTSTPEGIKTAAKFRGELVDRFSQPLLPLAFASILLLFLGDAQNTRQKRGFAVVWAFGLALGLRAAHFAGQSMAVTDPLATPVAFLIPLIVIAAGLVVQLTDTSFTLPRPIANRLESLQEAVVATVERATRRMRGVPR